MKISSAMFIGATLAFGGGYRQTALAEDVVAGIEVVQKCPKSKEIKNDIRQKLIDDISLLINNAQKSKVDFPASDVLKLFGWLLKDNTNLSEEEELKQLNVEIDKQVEQWKARGLNFENEFGKIKLRLPKARIDLNENLKNKDAKGTKVKAGELLRINKIFLKATGLAEEMSKTDDADKSMSAQDAVAFVSVVFLSDRDVSELKHYIETTVKNKVGDGHRNSRRIEHYSSKLIEYIDEYIKERNNGH